MDYQGFKAFDLTYSSYNRSALTLGPKGDTLSHRDFEQNYPVIVRLALLITGLAVEKFRGKDIIFNVDLIKSLMSSSNHFKPFDLQATQIHRMMEKYKKVGWSEIINVKSAKFYRLLPNGVNGILETLVDFEYVIPLTETIMIQWFLKTYREPIISRIRPNTSSAELKNLQEKLEDHYIVKVQLALLDQGIKEMQIRIKQSQQLQDYIKSQIQTGADLMLALKSLPTEFSYKLTHQKKFWQWLAELPEDVRAIEVERGFSEREKLLYGNSLNAMMYLRGFYENLLKR